MILYLITKKQNEIPSRTRTDYVLGYYYSIVNLIMTTDSRIFWTVLGIRVLSDNYHSCILVLIFRKNCLYHPRYTRTISNKKCRQHKTPFLVFGDTTGFYFIKKLLWLKDVCLVQRLLALMLSLICPCHPENCTFNYEWMQTMMDL